MARPLRLEFAGALYHVTSRGDRREDIYENNHDRHMFLSVLDSVCANYNWVCHAYCLMGNHYHLLIETPEANLSKGMRQLNGVYTQRFNKAYGRVGHVFQGRYQAILVEKDSYLLALARYIVLNPVRAAVVDSAADWPWSSYLATAGLVFRPRFLATDCLLGLFGQRKNIARQRYRQFITDGEGHPSPWKLLRHQLYLGSDSFVCEMQGLIDEERSLSEVPVLQRRPVAKPLAFYEKTAENRNSAIISARESGGYTLKQIGDFFDLHYSTISGIVNDHKSKT